MSSMLKWVSNVGDTAYKTASKAGLAAGSDQPPYPCALPLHTLHDVNDVTHVEALLDYTLASVQDMLHDMHQLNQSLPPSLQRSWRLLDMADPDGDLRMYTRSHVGPYNFAKATMSLAGVPPQLVLMCMHAQDYQARRRYSDHLREYAVLARNPRLPREFVGHDDRRLHELAQWGIRNWFVEYNHMHAPPPVASRDLVFLVEKRYVPAEDCYYIYGCSVDYVPYRKHNTSCVRAIAMWGWQLTPLAGNNSTLATYVTCMNPNGWTPTFIIGWMQMAIAKELRCSRALLYEDSKTMAAVVHDIVQQQQQHTQEQQQQQQRQRIVTTTGGSNNSSSSKVVGVDGAASGVMMSGASNNGSSSAHMYSTSHHVTSSSYCSNSSSNSSNVTSSCMVDNDDVGEDDPGAIAVAALYARDHATVMCATTPRIAAATTTTAASRHGKHKHSIASADSGSNRNSHLTLAAMVSEDTRCYADDEEPLLSFDS